MDIAKSDSTVADRSIRGALSKAGRGLKKVGKAVKGIPKALTDDEGYFRKNKEGGVTLGEKGRSKQMATRTGKNDSQRDDRPDIGAGSSNSQRDDRPDPTGSPGAKAIGAALPKKNGAAKQMISSEISKEERLAKMRERLGAAAQGTLTNPATGETRRMGEPPVARKSAVMPEVASGPRRAYVDIDQAVDKSMAETPADKAPWKKPDAKWKDKKNKGWSVE